MLLLMTITSTISAQVGIGTITPHASSVLDVSSTTQGMLAPRMTTAQRTAIVSPADGLMVYDTDLKSLFHYNSSITSWNVINSGTNGRLKFKRIKSTDVLATVLAAEKTAGGSTKYLLDTSTYYEINGSVNFDLPIDLNNAYVSGQDANEDKLVRTSGNLFDGATGGSIRNVTIQVIGGKVFNLSGTATQNLIFRDAIIAGSSNVGSVTGFGLVFVGIVQFVGNTTGIVYDTISKLLISNAAWFSNNAGTYEKLQGTFDLVQKQGGFSEVSGTAIGFDVSSNPTINGDAVMESVVFTGSNTAGYVKPYTVGSYTGYNFNNKWNVRNAGIPTESDASATGEFSVNYQPGSGLPIAVDNAGTASKISAITTSTNLFRFSANNSARVTYLGANKRILKIGGSLSFVADSAGKTGIYIFYIAKNGVLIGQSKIYGYTGSTSDVISIPLSASTEMMTNDYLEVYVDYFSGTSGKIKVTSLTVSAF